MADGHYAPGCGGRVVGGGRPCDHRDGSGSAAASHRTLSRGARPRVAAAGPGSSRSLRSRRESLHRDASQYAAAGVHGSAIRPAPVVRSPIACASALQMMRDLTTSWKNEIAKAAMLGTGDANLVNQIFHRARAGSSLPDRMHGRFPENVAQPASRYWRTIRICSTISRLRGT